MKFTQEFKEKIINEYKIDKFATFLSLSRKYGVCDRTISDWISKAGIPKKQTSGKLSHCNEDYFSEINTPNRAYLLGFITADGSITRKKGSKTSTTCSIEIHKKDADLIYFAREEINPSAAVINCEYPEKNKHNIKISFNSKKLCEDLSKYGVIPNKSLILEKVPLELIPKNLLCFYFRGLIDGDGSISKKGEIILYSGSKQFIESAQNILVQEVGVKKLKIYHGTTYFIGWGSKEDKIKLYNFLYGNLEATFYLKRKFLRLHHLLYGNTEVTN